MAFAVSSLIELANSTTVRCINPCGLFRMGRKLSWISLFMRLSQSDTGPICNTDCRRVTDVQAIHWSKCLTFITENQGCSRLGITRAEYRSFRWLLHNDTEWLAHYLPIPSQKARQSDLPFWSANSSNFQVDIAVNKALMYSWSLIFYINNYLIYFIVLSGAFGNRNWQYALDLYEFVCIMIWVQTH